MAKHKKVILDFSRCRKCKKVDFEKFTINGRDVQTRNIPCKCAIEHEERLKRSMQEHPSKSGAFKRKKMPRKSTDFK